MLRRVARYTSLFGGAYSIDEKAPRALTSCAWISARCSCKTRCSSCHLAFQTISARLSFLERSLFDVSSPGIVFARSADRSEPHPRPPSRGFGAAAVAVTVVVAAAVVVVAAELMTP